MARIAVTGANGFVGRHVVAALSAAGHEPIGVIRSQTAASRVEAAGGHARQVPALAGPALAEAFEGAAAVVHLAQIGAERGGATYEGVNVQGTLAVIEACRSAAVPRVVFLSGLGVAHYGVKPRCSNAYFLSKQAAETALLGSGLEVAVFRPSYVLGPAGELVADLLAQLRSGRVQSIGAGEQRMQPIAVSDAARLVARAASAAASGPRPVLDLVGPEPVTLARFTERLARVAGIDGYLVDTVSEEEADALARAGGWRGMLPDELDCLLCDEVGDPTPLVELLGHPLRPIDGMLREVVAGHS